jgi:hypothetical protein
MSPPTLVTVRMRPELACSCVVHQQVDPTMGLDRLLHAPRNGRVVQDIERAHIEADASFSRSCLQWARFGRIASCCFKRGGKNGSNGKQVGEWTTYDQNGNV